MCINAHRTGFGLRWCWEDFRYCVCVWVCSILSSFVRSRGSDFLWALEWSIGLEWLSQGLEAIWNIVLNTRMQKRIFNQIIFSYWFIHLQMCEVVSKSCVISLLFVWGSCWTDLGSRTKPGNLFYSELLYQGYWLIIIGNYIQMTVENNGHIQVTRVKHYLNFLFILLDLLCL